MNRCKYPRDGRTSGGVDHLKEAGGHERVVRTGCPRQPAIQGRGSVTTADLKAADEAMMAHTGRTGHPAFARTFEDVPSCAAWN